MSTHDRINLRSVLEGCGWLAFLTSSLSILILALANVKSLQIGLSWLAITLWFWFFVAYSVGLLALGTVLWGLGRVTSMKWLRYCPGAIGCGFFLFVAGSNVSLLLKLPTSTVPLPFKFLNLIWVLVVLVGLILLFDWFRRRWPVRISGLVVFLVMGFSLVPYVFPDASVTAPDVPGVENRPVMVLGLDGADWEYLDPLIEAGELPNLAQLKQNSARGNLKTIEPTKSPAIWTTMATGEPPSEHGITQFVGNKIRGNGSTFSRIQPVSGIGLNVVLSKLLKVGSPLHSGNRQEAAYWNIASAYDQPSLLVNWWMTWPASKLEGWMVTERIHSRSFGSLKRPDQQENVTFPPSLREEIESLRFTPESVTYKKVRSFMDVSREEFRRMQTAGWERHQLRSEFKYMYSMFETNRRITTDLYDRAVGNFDGPVDLFVTFRLLDIAGHTALRYSDLTPSHPSVDERDESRYGSVVTEAYRRIDSAVGEILEHREGGYVLVVSDHGFDYNPDAGDPAKLYDHNRAPDGIWMLSGPGVKEGEFPGLSVYDIMPILAYVKGLPLSRDWRNPVPFELFESSFRSGRATISLESYDNDYLADPGVNRSGWDEEKFKNRLKALGYLE